MKGSVGSYKNRVLSITTDEDNWKALRLKLSNKNLDFGLSWVVSGAPVMPTSSTSFKKRLDMQEKFEDWLSSVAPISNFINETSLGLAKKTSDKSSTRDAVDQVSMSTKESMYRKIIVMLKRAGFKKCQDPYMFECSPYPKRPLEFTTYMWEDNIGDPEKNQHLDVRYIRFYLGDHIDPFDDEKNMACVNIVINLSAADKPE